MSLNILDHNEERIDPFNKLRKISVNTTHELFEDDQFKLPEDKLPKGVIKTRLSNIFPIGLSITEPNTERLPTDQIVHHHPTYLP